MEPYFKFVTPALLAIVGTILTAIQQGVLDVAALEVGVFGLAAATISFLVTNGSTGVKKYMKALAPALTALVGIGLHYVFVGEFNEHDARAAVVVGISALLTLFVPNDSVETRY